MSRTLLRLIALAWIASLAVYLLPAVGFWCAAASVQAKEVGWAVVGPSTVAGLGLTILAFAATA